MKSIELGTFAVKKFLLKKIKNKILNLNFRKSHGQNRQSENLNLIQFTRRVFIFKSLCLSSHK